MFRVGAKKPNVSSNTFCLQSGSVEMSSEIGFGETEFGITKGVVLIAFSPKETEFGITKGVGLIAFSTKGTIVICEVGVGLEFDNWAKTGIDTIKPMYAIKRTAAATFKINFFVVIPPGPQIKNTLRYKSVGMCLAPTCIMGI